MADHAHAHAGHDHDHGHAVSPDADRRWLTLALAIVLGFMVVEVGAGVVASSLALLSDAAHMLTDAGAILLAIVAARLAARPPGGRYTFGLGRTEILSAQVNGVLLLVLAGVIAVEAIGRLGSPRDVEAGIVVAVGLLGSAVNVAAAWALSRAERRSLNVEGARQHVLTDLYASLAAVAAGVVILVSGFAQADAIAALLVSALMVLSGWRLLRDAGRVLLEAAPAGMNPQEIGRDLAGRPGIREVHDLHVWEVTTGFPALAAHVLVDPDDDCHGRRHELEDFIRERFGIAHTTLQVEHEPAEKLLEIERRPADGG